LKITLIYGCQLRITNISRASLTSSGCYGKVRGQGQDSEAGADFSTLNDYYRVNFQRNSCFLNNIMKEAGRLKNSAVTQR